MPLLISRPASLTYHLFSFFFLFFLFGTGFAVAASCDFAAFCPQVAFSHLKTSCLSFVYHL